MQSLLQTDQNQGLQIGNYLLRKTIGTGTFGKVKLAIHIPTNEQVAIKIIMKSKIAEVADFQRVSRQIHILRIVRHPSIIQLYQIIETKDQLFLVTQLAQKGELFDHLLKRGELQEKEACNYFKQLISGIQYLHKLKIAHRDLKLENILLDYQNDLKIIDFGLSNTYCQGQMLKTACGSPCYASPEMIMGKRYDGLAGDIWSCGVILFAMVCGYLPFQDQNTNQLYKKIKAGSFSLPSNVSSNFKSFIRGIIEVNPSKRFKLSDIYSHPWFSQIQQKAKKGIKVGSQLISADPLILSAMRKMGFDMNHTKLSVQANKEGKDLAAYYLQLKKMRKQGYESQNDVNSKSYKLASNVENRKQSFQNTRKQYYFGVSQMPTSEKKKADFSSKEKVSVKKKTNIKSQNSFQIQRFSSSKKKLSSSKERFHTQFSQLKKKMNQFSTNSVYINQNFKKRRTKIHHMTNDKSNSSNHKKFGKDLGQMKNKSCNIAKRFDWS